MRRMCRARISCTKFARGSGSQPPKKPVILYVLDAGFHGGEPLQVTSEELAAGGKRKFKFSRMTLCFGPERLSLFIFYPFFFGGGLSIYGQFSLGFRVEVTLNLNPLNSKPTYRRRDLL